MKVLIVNKFFYPRGGDCVVAMSIKQMLENHGHDVRVFAMDYPDNIDIPDKSYYAPQVDFGAGISGKLQAALRMFGKGSVTKSLSLLLDEFKPDVVHLHNIHSYLSPVVGEMAKKRGIKVVWTLHDYKLVCPSYACTLPSGEQCETCIGGKLSVVRNRCMKGSLVASLLADIEARYWNRKKLSSFTDTFIAPSEFMRSKMIKGGFSDKQIITLHNFILPERLALIEQKPMSDKRGDYYCYVGRLSKEKGVETMLKASKKANIKIKLAGSGPLEEQLKNEYSGCSNIEFLGHLDSTDVIELLMNAKASILPSEWYENNPLGIIESLCCGTPVIGAAIGGIPELIDEHSGILFSSGNVDELTQSINKMKNMNFNYLEISGSAKQLYGEKIYYQRLCDIYKS